MPAMIMESFHLWHLNHFKIFTRSLVWPQSHGIIRLTLYVIMDFIFYFSIGFGTAYTAYHMFAIDVIGEFRHTHLVQAFVLKPRKAIVGRDRLFKACL
jgi:hypothetical protein